MKAVRQFYKSLPMVGRKRLLLKMGISQSTFYRRTADTLTAYEIKSLIWAGFDKDKLMDILGL